MFMRAEGVEYDQHMQFIFQVTLSNKIYEKE